MKIRLALGVIAMGCGCGSTNPVDVGSRDAGGDIAGPTDAGDPACQGPQLPIVGIWRGYIENFTLMSGSDSLLVRISAATSGRGCGKVILGTKSPADPATDPDIGYPPGQSQVPGTNQSETFFLNQSEGFAMPLRDGMVSAARLRFKASWHEYWDSWCVLQKKTVAVGTDDMGAAQYKCSPLGTFESDGCYLYDSSEDGPTGSRHLIDCNKLALCMFDVCVCTGMGCTSRTDADFTFDLRVNGSEAVGSVRIGTTTSELHNVYLTQDN